MVEESMYRNECMMSSIVLEKYTHIHKHTHMELHSLTKNKQMFNLYMPRKDPVK